jgi:hypothetical protein
MIVGQANKGKWLDITKWLIFAFWLGVFLALGGETVRYWYPSKPSEIIVKHQYETTKGGSNAIQTP